MVQISYPYYHSLWILSQLLSLAAAVDVDTTTVLGAAAAAAVANADTTTALDAAAAAAAAAADTTTDAAAAAAALAATTATTTAVPAAANLDTTTATTPTIVTTTPTTATPAVAAANTLGTTDTTNTLNTANTANTALTGTNTATTTTPVVPTTKTAVTNTKATNTIDTDTAINTNTDTVATVNTDTDTDTATDITDTDTDTINTKTKTTNKVNTDTDTETDSTSTSTSSAPAETINPDLVSDSVVGTWSSKSNSVFTGPGFYDPVDELLIEPALPGISYSFTEDGFWEEAIYQVSSNAKNHSCATAVLIFQHGTYEKTSNGSLILTPFDVDGRQLLSQPCDDGGVSIYSRYTQEEKFKAYQVYVDPYHGKWRIDLIKSNGAYLQPLYLAYKPPQMLPTITLNPTPTSGDDSKSTETSKAKLKRRELGLDLSLSERIKRSLENRYKTNAIRKDSINYSLWWWSSASIMGIGAILFIMA